MNRRRARARRRGVPLWDRPEGWFTEPVRAWFGEAWVPLTDWGADARAASETAARNRAARVALGDTGTIVGLSKRSDALLVERGRSA